MPDSELLSAFIDKELNSTELKRVKDLLASSGEWREELERLRSAKSLMETAPLITAPQDLMELLQRQAEPASAPARKWFWELPKIWVMAPTMAALVLMLGLWIGHQRSSRIEYLEFDTLLAIHNGNQIDLSTHHGILSAENYTAHLEGNNNASL